ncbi:hypothetical protein NM688_g4314 [Phlebia brevispora]|uniref:Uncharacterized protein n=1 Tax=Phlebia brevispora TaxID=194682 RepID=A0ACC1T3H6_9APHY|nr:hypothetical protein NM688_g4314 [Phlebia brevispora]
MTPLCCGIGTPPLIQACPLFSRAHRHTPFISRLFAQKVKHLPQRHIHPPSLRKLITPANPSINQPFQISTMFPPIPPKQKALLLKEAHGKYVVVDEADIPQPGRGEVLIREEATGLNLVDKFTQETGLFAAKYPLIGGWEGAGVVIQLGEGVRSVAVGDRVFHSGRSGDKYATYQQYTTTLADLVVKIPRNLSYDRAAAIPVALNTAALGLYAPPSERGGAGLISPWQSEGHSQYVDQPIFILGGSSSVGQFVIQLARISGFAPIITTASLKNADYLKSLGATHVLDRKLPTSAIRSAIKEITTKPFKIVYDAMAFEDTQHTGYEVLAPGGTMVIVTSPKIAESERSPDKHISFIFADPTIPDRTEIARNMYKHISGLFASGELKPNHIEVLPNGLAGIAEGLERLAKWEVSARKLIAHPQETAFQQPPRVPERRQALQSGLYSATVTHEREAPGWAWYTDVYVTAMVIPDYSLTFSHFPYEVAAENIRNSPDRTKRSWTALVLPTKFGEFEVREVAVPELAPGEVLVRAEAVGLNPSDGYVKYRDLFSPEYPLVLGWDAAGVVVQLGEGVTSPATGDKAFHPGVVYNQRTTTFKQYNAVPADLCAKVPSNLTMDEAATIPLVFDTAAFGLYVKADTRSGAGLTPPWEEGGLGKYSGQPIVILGGSSSIGQFVIQLARLSGFTPIIAVASLKNEEYLKSRGATHVVDRNLSSSDLSATIKEIAEEPVRLVFDAVSVKETQNAGYDILAPGGTLVIDTRSKISTEKVSVEKHVTAVVGDPFAPDRHQFAVEMFKAISSLFQSGDFKVNRIEVLANGLAGIPEGITRYNSGQISAKKLVARPPETL